jgi:UDP-3-O-[3-hydroxymyristoyl] glucosamine N-acyltransferase
METTNTACSSLTMAELAARISGAQLVGSGEHRVSALVHPAEVKSPEQICLLMSAGALQLLERGIIRCAVVGSDLFESHQEVLGSLDACIHVARPRHALGAISRLFPRQRRPEPGIHPTAFVEEGAQVAATAVVGPQCVVRSGAVLGEGCWLTDSVTIGEGSVVGDDCMFRSGVRVADGIRIGSRCIFNQNCVIGSDGFSFVTPERGSVEAVRGGDRGKVKSRNHEIERIESLGSVIIGDDVEIGSSSCIDRAALGNTIIGSGTKIDNLCQIAHNVELGRNCLLASHNGIAGSTKIGERVVFGGQAGAADHLNIGDDVVVMARGGVIGDIEEGRVYAGFPARPVIKALKGYVLIDRLGAMAKDIRRLKKAQGLDS